MDDLFGLLKTGYGIVSQSAAQVPGGFSAKAAYLVTGADGAEYFLKVYDKALPTTRMFVARIDAYMPILEWLSALPSLRGRVITPVLTRNDGYKIETGGFVYVLFIFVHGEKPGIHNMTREQTVELAKILAALHETDRTVLPKTPGLSKDTSLAFCDRLPCFINKTDNSYGELLKIISPHSVLLLSAVNEALRLRDTVRLGHTPLVLCHGDAHGNNLIQSDRLVLTDWEDLRIAPAEADLFIHDWHTHGDLLLEAYSEARGGYRINRELVYYYVLRRRIEDVWVDIQRLTEENPDAAETAELLDGVRIGIEKIHVLMKNHY